MKRSLVLWISAIGAIALVVSFAKVSGVNEEAKSEKLAVVVVGHGIAPKDFPREIEGTTTPAHTNRSLGWGRESACRFGGALPRFGTGSAPVSANT